MAGGMKAAGLSLDQAPPLDLPFRFFLTAPLFGVAAGLVGAWQGEALVASRWTPGALSATHLLAIGFLSQIMCGALLQMLPVIAGSPVPAVRPVGAAVHLLLSAGAALLGWGFLGGGNISLVLGAGSAAIGFLIFVVPVAIALARARGVPDSVLALRMAVGALVVTVFLGVLLSAALQDWIRIASFSRWVDVHLAWGLLGWIGLLILGVAYQVVPMFHVTEPYPPRLIRWLAPLIVAALTVGSLLILIDREGSAVVSFAAAAACFVLFAVVTIRLQSLRHRPRVDATLVHWWAALAAMLAAAAVWVLQGAPELIGSLLLVGVGVGLSSGMLFKIVPFLSWFHLQHRQLATGRLDVRDRKSVV